MAFWIFKTTDQSQYLDEPGIAYAYDNTHSVRVRAGDAFLYLDKRRGYAFTGAGQVADVTRRLPLPAEQRSPRVRTIFLANLTGVIWFDPSLDISSSVHGRQNRRRLGLPSDVNTIGWSLSMPSIHESLFRALLDAALDSSNYESPTLQPSDWYIPDTLGVVLQRARMAKFRKTVLSRHCHRCVVCGTSLRSVLQAAHLCPYADDPMNRANPANGVCVCSFCHIALDADDISLRADGSVEIHCEDLDPLARMHFTRIDAVERRTWLAGVDLSFLTS